MRGLTFDALHSANVDRQAAWCPDQTPSLSFRGNELAGETGEACNVIKKLERERHGWAGSRDTLEHLAEELADVVICADLCAITAGVDLSAAVVAKFNATSEKVGLPHRLAEPVPTAPATGAQAVIKDGKIVISIDVDALPLIVSGSCATNEILHGCWKVTDPAEFAKEVCHALNRESEIGTTPVHVMFDRAFLHVIEQGGEGIDQVSEAEFEAEAARLQKEAAA
ncbi:MAG: MazG-like family protein [Brevundimonas sp.]|uniref:MazG-like family protein n=1 Tax=Brevundimonas sp. TaxID=1871086 RepID=UPI00391A6C2D